MNELMLIKIGGGFITHKDQPETPNLPALEHIAREIAQFRREYPAIDLIVGNGAGSYAHFPAHKHGLNAQRWQPVVGKAFGVAETHHSAQRINSRAVEVVYLANIDGVLDTKSRVIAQLHRDDIVEVQSEHGHDISRGILGKVEAARAAADIADAVYIAGGWQRRALHQIRAGEHVGTRVL